MAGKEVAVKKHVVRLSAEEREKLAALIRSGKWSTQLLTKARILLKADVSEAGEGWSDSKIAEALDTSVANIERTRAIVDWIDGVFPDIDVGAVGHRIVHGGVDYAAPVVLDDRIVAALEALIPLAPLHQPHNLSGVAAARIAFPCVPQFACFDTAFRRGHDFINEAYAQPRALYDRGLRRFSFHGLS